MKTMSLAIFAIMVCGAVSWSLRGQSSLLQRQLALPQNTSEKQSGSLKTLEDMEATLMRMARSGKRGTPLKNFADLIMPHLHSMEEAINNSHTSDQTTMDSFSSAFTACTTAKTTADGEASALLTGKTNLSTAHKACRLAESMAETSYSSCITAKDTLKTAMTTACDAYTLANKVPDINLVPHPGQGASYRSWLVSVKDWVINELATLDAANTSCVSATLLSEAKKLECEGTNGNGGLWQVHNNLQATCNANQTALESAACSYADKFEGSCTEYATCYTNANNSYYAGVANLAIAQDNRVNEYLLVKRIKCFSTLFAAADGGDLSSADIDACKTASHDTGHLNLTYPILPIAPGTCTDVDQKPCTTNYKSTEYGSLPSNAQATACTVCPSAAIAAARRGYVNMAANQNTYVATSSGATSTVSEAVGVLSECPPADPDCIFVGMGGTSKDVVREWANTATKGKQFSIHVFRSDPQTFTIYATEDANVVVTQGAQMTKIHEFSMTEGEIKTFSGNYVGQVLMIEATGDILVSKESTGPNDYTNLVPAAQVIYGSLSTAGYITVFGGATTTITQACSDGYTHTWSGNYVYAESTSQRGHTTRACKYSAPAGVLISGQSWADGDGSDGITYLPSKYFQLQTPIPVNLLYVKLISDKQASCSYGAGVTITLSGNAASGVYETRIESVNKGEVITCDSAVTAYGDEESTKDEFNLIAVA